MVFIPNAGSARSLINIEYGIAVNKSRLKSYNGSYYLKDKQEFEIELFNPLQGEVKVEVEIQGNNQTAGGLILRPGERVFLDCNIDTNKRFKFETYQVEDSKAAAKAIAQNGDIVIKAYDRHEKNVVNQIRPRSYKSNPCGEVMFDNNTLGAPVFGAPTSGTPFVGYCGSTSSDLDLAQLSVSSASCSMDDIEVNTSATLDFMETGRVQEGSNSDQEFETIQMDFKRFPFAIYRLKILPESAKPVTTQELRSYCTECGNRRRKDLWKFCPKCGTKY